VISHHGDETWPVVAWILIRGLGTIDPRSLRRGLGLRDTGGRDADLWRVRPSYRAPPHRAAAVSPLFRLTCYKYHMKSIGIRELRQHASRYLRDAERGETIEITDRGRPLARLVPIAQIDGAVQALISAGRLTPATRDLGTLPPIDATPSVPLPSEILDDARAHER